MSNTNKITLSIISRPNRIWKGMDPKADKIPMLTKDKLFVPQWDVKERKYKFGPTQELSSKEYNKEIDSLVKGLRFTRPNGSVIDTWDVYNKDDDFFTHDNMKVKLGKDIITFDLDSYKQKMEWYIMANSPDVAMSKKEVALKPRANWLVEDPEKEAEINSDERSNYIKLVKTFDDLNASKKRIVLTCFGVNADNRSFNDTMVEDKLWELINAKSFPGVTDPKKLFLKLTSESEGKLEIIHLVEQAYNYSVLRKNQGGEYLFNAATVAKTKEELITKLNLPENSSLFLSIKEALNIKKQDSKK
jgi:hypothetical protein